MALVNNMEKISRNANVHEEVEATFNIVQKAGKKYIQINTYGSKERKAKGVVSQTLQFSEEAIYHLQEIIKKEF
ncbi:hypothetical protein V7124_21620 [Neobacillus niacini]|uniref:hypothetical protein n=1 Tax=Neobacillus niacini TaxID=86668 RepID=UPI002FFF8B0C